MQKRAALLAIGTELTTGEIVNGNGAWLAEKLGELGFLVTSHVVVADDRRAILDTLNWLESRCEVLVVTGGLGPTSDDFTREVVAEWAARPLEFAADVWEDLNRLCRDRGLTIREAHRRQCHFPRDSARIANPVGTALGFWFDRSPDRQLRVAVLPGPPREIQGMWDQGVAPILVQLAPQAEMELRVWTCLGAPESEVAEVTERVIKGSGLVVGYRATVPYVKVKLWLPRPPRASAEQVAQAQRVAQQLETALGPWVVATGKGDIWLDLLAVRLKDFVSVRIVDAATGGRIAARLEALRDSGFGWPHGLTVVTGDLSEPNYAQCELAVSNLGDNNFKLSLKTPSQSLEHMRSLPFKIPVASKRGALYVTELAAQWWRESLK